jgi:hypothetical protein
MSVNILLYLKCLQVGLHAGMNFTFILSQGRLYEKWISYPVDTSYLRDKSPIQWIAICPIKNALYEAQIEGWIAISRITLNYNFNRRKPDFPEISHLYVSRCQAFVNFCCSIFV